MRVSRVLLMGVVTLMMIRLGNTSSAQQAFPALPSTKIVVPKMHCMECAKKMATELYKVGGVGQVLAKVDTTTLTIRPKDAQAVSPRALWEAVEKAGYEPGRLEGPSGVFTSKPKS